MTKQDLKKLKRVELLELLVEEGKENEKLQARLTALESQLENRDLAIQSTGSIAEASLELNGVFSAAQEAANQYLDNIRQMKEKQSRISGEIEDEARAKADALLAETKARCQRMEREAWETCDHLEQETKARCKDMMDMLTRMKTACGQLEREVILTLGKIDPEENTTDK